MLIHVTFAAPKALYLHVPFCPKVCPYCDFHKMHRDENLVAAYLERLEREAKTLHAEFPAELDTIYLGGGTPSHLKDDELARVVNILKSTWGFPARVETTLEADPLTFDRGRLETFKTLGFNRLSIGLQSTQDEVLKFLGRLHDGRAGLQAVELALGAGFEVSADLITGINTQDAALDLQRLAATRVPHISVYSLVVEPYTPFALRGVEVDEDKESADFDLATQVLVDYGLERYEVSSHAKPGHESNHNQAYWRGDYFLNLGPSAAGFVPAKNPNLLGERRTNLPIKNWLQNQAPNTDAISSQDYVLDVLLTSLRTHAGLDSARLESRSGINVLTRYADLIAELEQHKLLYIQDGFLKTTEAGLRQLNGVVRRFWQA